MTCTMEREAGLPPEWRRIRCPGQMMTDALLAGYFSGAGWAAVRRDREGFTLALPWRCGDVFPVPPLFCLARCGRLGPRSCVLFSFDRQGRPFFDPAG